MDCRLGNWYHMGNNRAYQIRGCPACFTCVSSVETDGRKAVLPIQYTGPAKDAWKRLITILADEKRASMFVHDYPYMHLEFRSAVFRFVDDVEFLLDDESKCIHVRSASRVGVYDLGVNRRRIEGIRKRFVHQESAAPSAM